MRSGGVDNVLYFNALEDINKCIPESINAKVIIGIPFYNEKNTLLEVIKIAKDSLKDLKEPKLVMAVGDPAGKDVLDTIKKEFHEEVIAFLMPKGVNGRGFSIRAILEAARKLKSDAVLLEADLMQEKGKGIKSQWVDRLYQPIAEGYHASIAVFQRHPLEDTAGPLLVAPLLSVLYRVRFTDPLSGLFALSGDIIEELSRDFDKNKELAGGYGLNPWLLTFLLRENKKICEVYLGCKLSPSTFCKRSIVFKEMVYALFSRVIEDEKRWKEAKKVIKFPDLYDYREGEEPKEVFCNYEEYVKEFKAGYTHYRKILSEILHDSLIEKLDNLLTSSPSEFSFSGELWAKIVYSFLLGTAFQEERSKDDLMNSFLALYEGRVAGYIKEHNRGEIKESFEAFEKEKVNFTARWKEKSIYKNPALTPLDYIEYIPGVPIVIPKRLKGIRGKEVYPNEILKRLHKKYKNAFSGFVSEELKTREDEPERVVEKYREFIMNLERKLKEVFPGELSTEKGLVEFCNNVFTKFPHGRVLAIKWEILRKIVYEFPPRNLLVMMKYKSLREMLDNVDVRDILTLAQYTEDADYFERIFSWLKDNLRHDSFEETDIAPVIINRERFPGISELREISDYNRLTARISVVTLGKGMGGDYPKVRYFCRIAKSLVEAEYYSKLWATFSAEHKEVGIKVINSIKGHYGKNIFSAHHIFENIIHREFVKRVERLAGLLQREDGEDCASFLRTMVRGYGLSATLKDGTFMPCSVWTWASYSFKGGEGIPTPLFLHVERDWFNHDFIEEVYRELGNDVRDIERKIFNLIGLGREAQDLRQELLGAVPYQEEVVIQDIEPWPPAGVLKRYKFEPILSPIKEHWWENRYVLNAAAFRRGEKVYILYRAYGHDEVSRIGLAITDGFNVIERLKNPIFIPQTKEEVKGCEDPRIVIIDDEIFMLYTAYDGVVAQIAAASIKLEDFLNREFDRWKRLGLAFPGLWDKDALLFPEKIDGKYVIYHRIEPSIWMAFSDELKFPWPDKGHKIIVGPRSGFMWDSLKIGAGAQPLKTKYGWLLIYHGVDFELVYRLGVLLVDLKDPGKVLYRSPNPVLSPETESEIGKKGESWVPNVVFTCGAVPVKDKEILEDEDEIIVYYGAADTSICAATGKVADLIPKEIRQRLSAKKA
ncbi:glycosidase [Thermovenabulum gondwanense]|uniref:1,4-beta-mannosyl-N-acetylglucosamine phosphorylase n=1 Tax=Thermovenabulum gondwanense TaxID=520767 RepID=A0A162MLB8_9FIRM|nr:glycosidase [Thermovenabulum gondwanense]KYO66553.1 1,4-beta-mannosyl-N-acetylglucosamine phosphorylase [Thermovenabulum gondwanense]